MLEKIGLPAKPSMRGSNWVIDASHCQGCSSQFTFINRKHHCRRCGGLFCNSCTQQRMVLRGQGDSPVRICDPCKKLEEAARFEMRHGHKSRAGRGGSKLTPKYEEDEVLNQILGTDGNDPLLSGRESTTDALSNLQRATSSASCSSLIDEAANQDGERNLSTARSLSVDMHNHALNEMGSTSAGELRQLAVEEKKKYRILKGEGKPEEALRAFKRGKELERQADALEIALRKSHKKASSSSNRADVQKMKDDPNSKESGRKSKLSPQVVKEDKDDLASELKELGWSDADLHDGDKKPAKMSLEGELSTLLGDIPRKPNMGKEAGGIDKTQVLAHKKKALMFKREGKLTEAKEELKKAKILEKQIEEQEFLIEADDSDDELSSLIHSLDGDKQDDFPIGHEQDLHYDFDHLVSIPDNLDLDGNFEVTDEDTDDPEIVAALKSLGWTEDSDYSEDIVPHSVPRDREKLLSEVLSLKREALNLKRAGNVVEAMAKLKKAKLLERDLERLQAEENSSFATNPTMQKGSTSQNAEKPSKTFEVDDETVGSLEDVNPRIPPKSKLTIQKELLGLKKKALALRREGRVDEAEDELKKGKVLERQLEEMENASQVRATKVNVGSKDSEPSYKHSDISGTLSLVDEGDEGDVTDQDMHDPALLTLLENLGWKDQDIEPVSLPSKPVKQIVNRSEHITDFSETQAPSKITVVAPRSKAAIQRELLGLKRKALTLRRQGETEEAEEVLQMAKVLEAQLAEMEVPKKELLGDFNKQPDGLESLISQEKQGIIYSLQENETVKPPRRSFVEERYEGNVIEQDMHESVLPSLLKNLGWNDKDVDPVCIPTEHSKQFVNPSGHATDSPVIQASSQISIVAPKRSKAEIQRELLGLKRKAFALRRQGETEEAEEVLRMAKVLEAQMEEIEVPKKDLLNSNEGKELDGLVSLVSQEKDGNTKAVEEVKKGGAESAVDSKTEVAELSMDLGWKESNTAKPPPGSSPILFFETSQASEDKTPSTMELRHPANKRVTEHAFFSQSGQSVNLMDLLTGDDWKSSQLPDEGLTNKETLNSNIPSLATPPTRLETFKNPDKELGGKDAVRSETNEKKVPLIPAHEVNSAPGSYSDNNKNSVQQEILARKRKAVSLKREGKLAEAREELRQAKLLEKILKEENPQTIAAPSDSSVSTSIDASVGKEKGRTTNQAPKPLMGRDRFKLQQESLAHKRQALKLRREGRTEEAEAEFELAKALEMQLEESAGHDLSNANKSVNEAETIDDVGVEDFLDPQLLSALKAIGLQDAATVSQASGKSEVAKPYIGKREVSDNERSQLEDKIKAEKVKALNLKRAGNQAEALDALRRAKQLEKKLNSLVS